LADVGPEPPRVILMASGSEVSLIVQAGNILTEQGIGARLVSFPSWEIFAEQGSAYQESVLTPAISARVAVEAGVTLGWHRWVGAQGRILGLDRFGASAPAATVFAQLGLTPGAVVELALESLQSSK
jgi:transketolase